MKNLSVFFVLAAFILPITAVSQPHDQSKMQSGQSHDKMNMGARSMAMGMGGIKALSRLSGKEFNIAFMSQMIAHHRGAIEMARQVLKVAHHAETRTQAHMVISDQNKEIAQMTSWLRKWYGIAPVEEQMDLVQADMKGMMSMKITTDRMFFEMMMPHHKGAIDMSQMALKQTDRAEVKQLARNIIKAQKAEIIRYKMLLKHVS